MGRVVTKCKAQGKSALDDKHLVAGGLGSREPSPVPSVPGRASTCPSQISNCSIPNSNSKGESLVGSGFTPI